MNLKDCKSTGEVQAYIITEILKPLNKDILATALDKPGYR